MSADAPKIVALTISVAVVVGVGLLWLPKLLTAVGGADTELITQLKTAERDGLELPVSGGTLKGSKVAYQRISVDVDGRKATVLATLDFTGTFGPTEVSSLGVEKIQFVYDGTVWKPQTSFAPRLEAVVEALERRRRGFESGNAIQLHRRAGIVDGGDLGPDAEQWLALVERKLQVDAWFIRLERDSADVSEQFRIEGADRDRPYRSSGPRKLHLQLRPTGEFFFPTGLM